MNAAHLHFRTRVANRVRGSAAEEPLRRVVAAFERGPYRRHREEHRRLSLLFAWTLKDDDCCIDVGANRGIVLDELVRFAPRGRHMAFEPIPTLHAELQRRHPEVDVRQIALSSEGGESTFTWFPEMPGFSRLGSSPPIQGFEGQQITVRKGRLDDLVPGDLVPRIIKVDAEGEDRAVLAGGMGLIQEHRPTIVFEHSGAGEAGDEGETEELVDLLCGTAGLRIFDLHGGGPYDLRSLREAYAKQQHINFLAHP